MRRLALFDLDGTLVDRDGAFKLWAREFTAEHGLDAEAFAHLVFTDAHHQGTMGGFFDRVREHFSLPVPAGELWARYRRRLPELISCRPEDADALRRMRAAGWTTGIVTNGMTDNQLGKIRRAGLDELVDALCVSEEAGCRKPDPEIFRLAARRCGTTLDGGGWIVGDSLTADIAGGRAVGLRTAWLRGPRAAEPAPDDPEPDLTVASVAEAVDALLSGV